MGYRSDSIAISRDMGPLSVQTISFSSECTKIAHRRSLAIFTADEGIARNSAARTIFTPFSSQKESRFASDFLRRGNRASWGLKKSRDFSGSGKNRRRSRRESRDFGALRFSLTFVRLMFWSRA